MELGSLRRKPGFCTIISSYCPALLTATGPIASTDEQSTDSRNAPPATRSVLDLHQTVLRDLNPDWAGRLRNAQVFIKGTRHTPPNAAHVSDELDALVAQIGQCALHPQRGQFLILTHECSGRTAAGRRQQGHAMEERRGAMVPP